MAGRLRTMVLAAATGPGAIWIATMALWENEDRFDYHQAARDAAVVSSITDASPSDAIAFTSEFDTTIRIPGEYVEGFTGYLRVRRLAEIYAWIEEEDDDGNVSVTPGWSSSVEVNSSNSGVYQAFSSADFTPERIELGSLEVGQDDLHYVDPYELIEPSRLVLSDVGRTWELAPEGEYFYLRMVPGETSISDERLQYVGIPAAPTATYFGRVEDGVGAGMQFEVHEGFISMLIRNDGMLHHLVNGARGEALATVRRHLAMTKWVVRVVGTLVMMIGFWILFGRFLSALYSVRLLRGVVEIGVFLLGIAVGLPFALLVIASSVFVHSPLLAAMPLALGLVGVAFLVHRGGVTSVAAEKWQEQEMARRRLKRSLREGIHAGVQGVKLAMLSEEERDARLDEAEIEETFLRLAALGHVEHGLGSGEKRFLFAWGRKNGLIEERMDQLMRQARGEATERIKRGDERIADAEDHDDLRLLVFVALADGVISALELEALRRIGERLGVGAAELRDMISSVEEAPEPV